MSWADNPECVRVGEAYLETFGREPEVLVRAPGRVALLGAHVDHQQGRVLTAAIDRAIYLAAGLRSDERMHLRALDLGERSFRGDPSPPTDGAIRWMDYPEGVFRILHRVGYRVSGLDAVYGGDLPREAGVSSSAAVEVAFLLAHNELADLEIDRADLAKLGQRVENDYLSVGSGVMDQTASLFGRRDSVLSLDCRDQAREDIPWPEDWAILLLDSGTRRALGTTGYADPQQDCARALEKMRANGLKLASLRELSPTDLDSVRAGLTESEFRRVRHVVEECDRVRRGADDLRSGAMRSFGPRMVASHASSRDLWGSSTVELDFLVDEAVELDGCLGAKLCGAGLGGCAMALVRQDTVDSLRSRLRDAFERRFARAPDVWVCEVADGAQVERCG